jgi:foldase protein PrsA
MNPTTKSAAALLAALTLSAAAALAADTAPAPPAPKAPAAAAAPAAAGAQAAKPAPNAEHIQVQHILIGFTGSVPGKNITRTMEEANVLANEVLARAKKGEDFAALVKEYTNDAFPGIYGMCNIGVTPAPGEFPRSNMVKGFGDVSFSLQVDEIGMASYDPATSKYGWHIIKRLK